jgi:anti-sigma B factor antagonist
MHTIEKEVGGVVVLYFSGRLDASAASEADAKLNTLTEKLPVRVVINLDKLDYISSSGLRVFLASLKKARKEQGDIKLACLQPYVKEVFDIAGFSTLFNIFDKEEEAINSFK